MAKRRRKNKSNSHHLSNQRNTNVISKRTINNINHLRSLLDKYQKVSPYHTEIRFNFDLRSWTPDKRAERRKIERSDSTPINPPVSSSLYRSLKAQAFSDVKKEYRSEVCRSRRDRREALFARGSVGRGKRLHTPKKFNLKSKVRC